MGVDSTIVMQGAVTLSPAALFMHADIIVKIVMLGLLAASVWTWAIIISQSGRLRRLAKTSERFERDFWKADDVDKFYEARGGEDLPSARVLAAGVIEWRRSTVGDSIDRDGNHCGAHGAVRDARIFDVRGSDLHESPPRDGAPRFWVWPGARLGARVDESDLFGDRHRLAGRPRQRDWPS